ncbi:MAG: exodeoxyribonuclease III [Defluviitaleaceae bacterium]|nr:exodeoxyribonuclease III [Defluviitaleaceae bacterium]
MKLGSWNVNGLRACMTKGFMDFFNEENFDILGLQEIKMNKEQGNFEFEGYEAYWNSAEKKGYSGTAVFAKEKPLSVRYGMGIEAHDKEGRVITVEYTDFFFVTVYTPNAKRDLSRLDYRMQWENDFKTYVVNLSKEKGVVICGDLNVAHQEIDLKNPKSNRKNAGFTQEERGKFSALLEAGFVDTFRYLNRTREGAYTWWSYMNGARGRNVGWRIDYFLVSENLKNCIESVAIYDHVLGSDHCPVGLTLRMGSCTKDKKSERRDERSFE